MAVGIGHCVPLLEEESRRQHFLEVLASEGMTLSSEAETILYLEVNELLGYVMQRLEGDQGCKSGMRECFVQI